MNHTINVTANRQMLRSVIHNYWDPFGVRAPITSNRTVSWIRRWTDTLIRGFLLWYSVVIVGLATVFMTGC
jgi:hypothetical protein